jgi:hypothetical protein
MKSVRLSLLPHVWLIDIDGTILKHNGHKMGGDELLPGVKDFWSSIPEGDLIILLSARTHEEMPSTLAFLDAEGIRYDHALFGMPKGERIVINDGKPGGLRTAIALNVERDEGLANLVVITDQTL